MKRSPQRKAALRRTASASERLQDRNRKQRRNLFLERLEDRSLLATMLWSGLGANQNVSTPANWVGNVAPQQDDSLVFPAGIANKSATFDPASAARYRTITISDGYTLGGSNAITLLEGVTFNSSSASATVSVPLTLGAAASIYSANVTNSVTGDPKLNLAGNLDLGLGQTLTTDGKGDINITGIVSGTGGSGITKLGDGTLILGGPNTFEGALNVNQGAVRVTNAGGLGSTAGGTFVSTGAAVQFQGTLGAS